ncbi:unannotated protein [freshwater metagenome]|uniref:Unannotated protein n=1 Tax=freshwater metagenome TaxID=449393 RepID=A0A6J6LEA4_9ZZZZ
MPSGVKSFSLPIPDNCKICGVLIAPPHKTTSREVKTCFFPLIITSTPVAVVPLNKTLVTCARVLMVKLGRLITGYKYARAALKRRPR